MDSQTYFLLYLVIYRLTVLAIGAFSIYLCFRLFSQSGSGQSCTPDTASTDVEAAGFKVSLTNFWPGTYFALFGTVLIGIMLWQNQPQFNRKELVEHQKENGSGFKTQVEEQYRDSGANLNGESQITLEQEWNKLGPNVTLSEGSRALSNIARILEREKRTGEAVAMARLAYLYGSDRNRIEHLILFADLLEADGNGQAAAEARAELAELQKTDGKGE